MIDESGRERRLSRSYGARLDKDHGSKVRAGDKLVMGPVHGSDNFEKEGVANFVDLIDGVSMSEVVDEATGISYKKVVDWKQQPKGSTLRPRITLRDADGEVVALENGTEARYFMSVDAILSVEAGQK